MRKRYALKSRPASPEKRLPTVQGNERVVEKPKALKIYSAKGKREIELATTLIAPHDNYHFWRIKTNGQRKHNPWQQRLNNGDWSDSNGDWDQLS